MNLSLNKLKKEDIYHFDHKWRQQAHGGSPEEPNIQTKIYLFGNSTIRQSSLKETLTVCIEAPQGSLLKK